MNTRPIPGFPKYEASDTGAVISHVRSTPRILRGKINHLGYMTVCPYRDGVQTYQFVHRLVLAAFVGPLPGDMEVRHLDGNPLNNSLNNLTYGTRSENTHDQVRHGTHQHARKTHCPQGHPYSGDNLYVLPGTNYRSCRTCGRERRRHYRAQRAAA